MKVKVTMNQLSPEIAVVSESYKERLLAKVLLPDDPSSDECWLWKGASHGQGRGYGKFRLGKRTTSAHRASYLLFNGEIPEGLVIGHSCNNERCCNPNHLGAVTQSDNILYSIICGRHNSCRNEE
jgi:hypothetical protein